MKLTTLSVNETARVKVPDKLHVFTFHLERLYRYINYKRVSLQICILVLPFAVFKIISFGQNVVLYMEAEGELQCGWWRWW